MHARARLAAAEAARAESLAATAEGRLARTAARAVDREQREREQHGRVRRPPRFSADEVWAATWAAHRVVQEAYRVVHEAYRIL